MDKGLLVCAQPVPPIKCRKTDIGNSLWLGSVLPDILGTNGPRGLGRSGT